MPPPSADDQVRFLASLQRILEEGGFSASYKFALLLALADIAVETGDDSGDELRVDIRAGQIHQVLSQNSDSQQQPAIVRFVVDSTKQFKSVAVLCQNTTGDRGSEYRWTRRAAARHAPLLGSR